MARINPKGLAAIAAAGLTVASPFLIHFIGKWEGNELTVYADRLAHNEPTVCGGITKAVTDTPIIVGEVWTQEKCDRETKQAAAAIQSNLIFCFHGDRTKIPPRVWDMASDHAWNFGYPKTCGSEAMKAWNQGDWLLGCRRLAVSDGGNLVWSYSDGKFLRGLANRRADEWRECAK